MFWPIFWVTLMVVLIAVTVVVSHKEKKARAAALKSFAPQPLGDVPDAGSEPIDDGFGEPDPVDSFELDDASLASTDDKSR